MVPKQYILSQILVISILFEEKLDIYFFKFDVPTTIGWIDMKYGTDMNAPFRMNCKNTEDPLAFVLVPSWDPNFNLSISMVYNQIPARV